MEQREIDLNKSNEELLQELKGFDSSIDKEGLKKIRKAVLASIDGAYPQMEVVTLDESIKNIYNVNCDKLLNLFAKVGINSGKTKGIISLDGKVNHKIEHDINNDTDNILGKNATKILLNSKSIYIETKETDQELYYFISSINGKETETYAINGKDFHSATCNNKDNVTAYRIEGNDNGLLVRELGITTTKMGEGYFDDLNHYGLDEYYETKKR